MKVLLVLAFCLLSRLACAQPIAIDRWTPALPTAGERHAANIASWGTSIAAVAFDGWHTYRTDCREGWDRCRPKVIKAAIRYGVLYGGVFLAKSIAHRARPCAPACGADNPNFSFYSAHTAVAFSTVGGARLAVSLPLAIGTGGLRVAAGRHWLTDTLAGAGAGVLASRIR